MARVQKIDFVFRRNGRVHLNRRGRQFSRLLAAEVCASAVVIMDTSCSEVVWRVLATHSIRQFPLQFPSRASQCAITFQLDSTAAQVRCELSASWVISGLRCDVDDIYALLEYQAANNSDFLPTFRDNLSVPRSKVKNQRMRPAGNSFQPYKYPTCTSWYFILQLSQWYTVQ